MSIALSLTPLLFALTVERKKLTFGGAMTAVVLNLLVALAFGDKGFALLITYFILALASDGIKTVNKEKHKSECRTLIQVLSNSLLAMLSALSYLIFSHQIFLFIFILVFMESLGDTAASGFGALAKNTFDPFRMHRVERGSSGGMSLIGTFGGLLFAFSLSALGGLLFSLTFKVVFVLFLCSTFGIVLDSALGSLVQLKYQCECCGKTVETSFHCNAPTVRIRGIYPFDNSFVNFISSLSTVFIFVIVYFLV